MKTDSLIEMLARQAGPAPRAVVARRLAPAVALGLLASALLALTLIGPVPAALYASSVPWVKLGYAAALAAAAGWLTAGLSRPLARLQAPRACVAAVISAMALLGAGAMWATPPGERMAALMGQTALLCPCIVLAVSLPALAATLWALRGLAPADARAAGLGAGLLSGAVGALGYSLACPEISPAFVAVWYSLGVGLTGLLGAALGPRVLRW